MKIVCPKCGDVIEVDDADRVCSACEKPFAPGDKVIGVYGGRGGNYHEACAEKLLGPLSYCGVYAFSKESERAL